MSGPKFGGLTITGVAPGTGKATHISIFLNLFLISKMSTSEWYKKWGAIHGKPHFPIIKK